MARRYQVVSGDGHLEIPCQRWFQRVPRRYRRHLPRLVPLPEGGEAWMVEGMSMVHNGTNIARGAPLKLRGASYWTEDGKPMPGTGGPAQRLKEQDEDGIDAEVLFPPVFISRFIEKISDRDAYRALVRAYNDYVFFDYCSLAPDRLIAPALIPVSGIEDAINELEYVHSIGVKAVCLSLFPNGTVAPRAEDDRFWGRAIELQVSLTAHVTMGTADHPGLLRAAVGDYDLQTAIMRGTTAPVVGVLCQLITSGVFDRLPSLRLYFAETNASWLPAVLYRMDDSYHLFREVLDHRLERLPSEYVSRHIFFGIVRDPVAIRCRDHLPVQNLMWGSDFPHLVTSYPRSREWLDDIFADAPAPLRHRILVENPCDFFGLDMNAELTPTPVDRL